MGIGGFLKKVGNNTLHDAEGIVDPRNYYRAGKLAVTHPIAFGEDVGKSYLDLARHPIRSLEHPLTTTLALLPVAGGVGKLADVGAEAGAVRYVKMAEAAKQHSMADYVRYAAEAKSIVPGARAARTARAISKAEKTVFKDLKYRPGKGGSAEDVPGISTDRGLLANLQAELGHPNTSYTTSFAGPEEQQIGLHGGFLHGRQRADTLVHPFDLLNSTSDGLTRTMLHEARHGFQKANWSRLSRHIDLHRPYEKQKMELDANAFSDSALPRYKGLVSVDPEHPGVPQYALPTLAQRLAIAKASSHPGLAGAQDYKGVQNVIDKIHGNFLGMPSEEEVLNHMDALVKEGKLSLDEAIDLQVHMADNPYELISYKKPTSKNDMLRRAITSSKSMRKPGDPTRYNPNPAVPYPKTELDAINKMRSLHPVGSPEYTKLIKHGQDIRNQWYSKAYENGPGPPQSMVSALRAKGITDQKQIDILYDDFRKGGGALKALLPHLK